MIFFDEGDICMKEFLEDYTKIIIFLVIVFIIICNIFKYQNYNNYHNAINYNNSYKIYLNGEKKDNTNFKISSLDKDKYTFEVDNKNKEIDINTNKSSNRRYFFISVPMFFH